MAKASDATLSSNPPDKSELGEELGVGATFPTTDFGSFAFGMSHSDTPSSGTEKNSRILARDPEAVPLDKLVEMRRRDGQTALLLNMFMMPILSCLREAEWVVPPDTKGGEKEVEFANNMFRLPPNRGGMTVPIRQVLKQTLLATLEGFSVFEEVVQVAETGPNKGKYVLRKLAHRDSRTIQFRVDETGGFDGVLQVAQKPDGTPHKAIIPKEKTLFFNVQSEQNPLYGRSLFEAAWYHYDVKIKWYYISQIAGQFAAVPGRVGSYPISASPLERQRFADALKSFAFNTSVAFPNDYKVSPFNGSSSFDFIKNIEHHSHLQSKSVMLQFVDSESRPQLIDNGSRDASADLFIQVLQGLMDDIAETWSNHLMPKYIDWNFGSGVYPQFRFGQLTDSNKDLLQSVFGQVMVSSVLNCTPEFVRQVEEKMTARLGLDVNYEEIRQHEKEAAEDAAKLAEQEAQAPAAEPPQEGSDVPSEDQQTADTPESDKDLEKLADDTALSATLQEDVDTIAAAAQAILESFPQQFAEKLDPELDTPRA